MTKRLLFLLIISAMTLGILAQGRISGKVLDAKTGEPISHANVFYKGGAGVHTDNAGQYSIALRRGATLSCSCVGYETQNVKLKGETQLDFSLKANDLTLGEAKISAKKEKYSRKDNPAVELIRNVIAAKSLHDLRQHDYLSYKQYDKLTFALNNVTPKVFDDSKFKSMPFLKDHVEVCNETGKLILPVSVDETVTQHIYRKEPKAEKEIIIGQESNGLGDIIATGDIMNTMLKDFFTTVSIYDDEIRLFRHHFPSPISKRTAISFYHYFLADTTFIDGKRCIGVNFTPANSQDFGFNGTLYILADGTYRVHRVMMGLPGSSDVNFVRQLDIDQTFEQLPSGEQILINDNMIVQMSLVGKIGEAMVKRVTQYSDHNFEPIPDKSFNFTGNLTYDPSSEMREESFWKAHRAEDLTTSERKVGGFVEQLKAVKWLKPIIWVGAAFVENHVEASAPDKPTKVDIGPINTMISTNFIEGVRFRASARTTANLLPHLFFKGHIAYGLNDKRWKGAGEVTYSFKKKAYMPHEFPSTNLTFAYSNEVASPSDKFMATDKDNVFASLKWTRVDAMMYSEVFKIFYDHEWNNNLRLKVQLRTQKDTPCGSLFYQPLATGKKVLDADGNLAVIPTDVSATTTDFSTTTGNFGATTGNFSTTTGNFSTISTATPDLSARIPSLRTGDISFLLTYQPGALWINTKDRRKNANRETTIYELSHTMGVRNVLSDYSYNITEAMFHHRIWVGTWGKMDITARAGLVWNKVPFPILLMPAANLSYITQRNTFSLINNMEFLNDRYASLMWGWDLEGKILNRIPLIKKLQWREYIGCNVLWGMLTDRNNPTLASNVGDRDLMFFPGRFEADAAGERHFVPTSFVMNPRKPYVEVVVGIHNILKFIHIQYVHRLNYLRPDIPRWGVRLRLEFGF